MSKRTMRKYDKEFKTNAVNLYSERKHSIAKQGCPIKNSDLK